MNNVMLDLETMGTNNDAAIIAIGACEFNATAIGERFYCVVDLATSTGKIDASTVYWWLQQSAEAREAILADPKLSERDALIKFAEFLPTGTKLWGNGATFDNIVIRSAFKRHGLVTPWSFRNDKCYRTINSMFTAPRAERTGVHHHALDDAIFQARRMIELAGVNPTVRYGLS